MPSGIKMKAIRQNYIDHIDFWQRFFPVQRGLKNRFGVRVRDRCCWALIQIGNEPASTFGTAHNIPVDLSILPQFIRIIVDEHCLPYSKSDLLDVLVGDKTFEEANRESKFLDTELTICSNCADLATVMCHGPNRSFAEGLSEIFQASNNWNFSPIH
jgi:hypothetical protein